MKNLFRTIILTTFLFSLTFAQNTENTNISAPVELKMEDGRIVIIKPNGTWEFKKISPQTSQSTETTNLISADLKGQNADVVFDRLLALKERLVKSEFESTAEFEKRRSEELKKPIVSNIGLNDTFAFVINAVRADYNADTKTMSFFLPVGKGSFDVEDKTLYSIRGFNEYFKGGIYYIDTYDFLFKRLDNFVLTNKGVSGSGFSVDVPLEVEDAKRLKTSTRAIVFVKFEEPYAKHDSLKMEGHTGRKFYVSLVDAYFFDPQLGKIFAKASELKK